MRRHCRGIQRSPMIGFEQNLKAQRCVLRKVGGWVRHADCWSETRLHACVFQDYSLPNCQEAPPWYNNSPPFSPLSCSPGKLFLDHVWIARKPYAAKKAGWVEIGNEVRANSCHATHWIIMASTYLRARTNIWFIYFCQYFEWYCICQIIFNSIFLYIKFTIQMYLILHPPIQLIKNHLEIKTYYLCYIFHNI